MCYGSHHARSCCSDALQFSRGGERGSGPGQAMSVRHFTPSDVFLNLGYATKIAERQTVATYLSAVLRCGPPPAETHQRPPKWNRKRPPNGKQGSASYSLHNRCRGSKVLVVLVLERRSPTHLRQPGTTHSVEGFFAGNFFTLFSQRSAHSKASRGEHQRKERARRECKAVIEVDPGREWARFISREFRCADDPTNRSSKESQSPPQAASRP